LIFYEVQGCYDRPPKSMTTAAHYAGCGVSPPEFNLCGDNRSKLPSAEAKQEKQSFNLKVILADLVSQVQKTTRIPVALRVLVLCMWGAKSASTYTSTTR
jgi:hypothetical protein